MFVLSKKSQKETFFDILDRKECFLDMFVLSKKNQKETFFDILDRKECFLDLKSDVLKKSRKSTFCKGVQSIVFVK